MKGLTKLWWKLYPRPVTFLAGARFASGTQCCFSGRHISNSAEKNGIPNKTEQSAAKKPKPVNKSVRKKPSKAAIAKISREKWLDSLQLPKNSMVSLPSDEVDTLLAIAGASSSIPVFAQNAVVIGIDPDFKGAIAVLRMQNEHLLPEVYDVPTVKVMVGKTMRLRPDTRSIVSLIREIEAPDGSVAYIENAMPHSGDGKQGWWCSGFGLGIWIGSLMASGISVVPVPPKAWKTAMGLSGASKDESRILASTFFPSLSQRLQKKRDHGRAEALLLAAFGKGMLPPQGRDSEQVLVKEDSLPESLEGGEIEEKRETRGL